MRLVACFLSLVTALSPLQKLVSRLEPISVFPAYVFLTHPLKQKQFLLIVVSRQSPIDVLTAQTAASKPVAPQAPLEVQPHCFVDVQSGRTLLSVRFVILVSLSYFLPLEEDDVSWPYVLYL